MHSAEELQIQIQQARERGLLAREEEKFILGAIELDRMQVRELMVPRPDVHFAFRRRHAGRCDARVCHDAALAVARL